MIYCIVRFRNITLKGCLRKILYTLKDEFNFIIFNLTAENRKPYTMYSFIAYTQKRNVGFNIAKFSQNYFNVHHKRFHKC